VLVRIDAESRIAVLDQVERGPVWSAVRPGVHVLELLARHKARASIRVWPAEIVVVVYKAPELYRRGEHQPQAFVVPMDVVRKTRPWFGRFDVSIHRIELS
jgi:hypothetical protein